MQMKHKDGEWQITISKTEMEKLDSFLGWLKPLTELSTPVKEQAESVTAGLEIIQAYLETNARPTTEEN